MSALHVLKCPCMCIVSQCMSLLSSSCSAADSLSCTFAEAHGRYPAKWERTLCKVIIPVSVLLSIIGIIFSITALVQREEEL